MLPSVGGATFRFDDGWGQQVVPQGVAEVREAALGAATDLQMRGAHQEHSGTSWWLDARAHDGRHVRACVAPATTGTQISVRIGHLGDQALSRAFFERIGERLGTLPPSCAPDVPPTSNGPGWFSRSAIPDSVMLPEFSGSQYTTSPFP